MLRDTEIIREYFTICAVNFLSFSLLPLPNACAVHIAKPPAIPLEQPSTMYVRESVAPIAASPVFPRH